jgi:hypothetical protein
MVGTLARPMHPFHKRHSPSSYELLDIGTTLDAAVAS